MKPSAVGIAGALSTEQDAAPEQAKTASPYYTRDELEAMRDRGGHYNAAKLVATALKTFELMNRARDEADAKATFRAVLVADGYEDEITALKTRIKELEASVANYQKQLADKNAAITAAATIAQFLNR